jgi:HSP20 family protein
MVTRWNPFREIATMQNAIDRMFDETWRTVWPADSSNSLLYSGTLPLDIYETESAYTVIAALPGVNPDQINVQWHKGTLTISAEVANQTLPENARWLAQERPTGRISRTVMLPQWVSIEQADAHYENGTLRLTLPKSPEAQPKLITIQSSNKQLESHNK